MRKYLFVYLNFCNFAKYLEFFDFFSLLAKLYIDIDKYSGTFHTKDNLLVVVCLQSCILI